jgi:hypothetical protein
LLFGSNAASDDWRPVNDPKFVGVTAALELKNSAGVEVRQRDVVRRLILTAVSSGAAPAAPAGRPTCRRP